MKTTHLRRYYKIRHASKNYPWPCEVDPKRMITVTKNDILSKMNDGTIIKHSQPGCSGILIPDEDLVELNEAMVTETA